MLFPTHMQSNYNLFWLNHSTGPDYFSCLSSFPQSLIYKIKVVQCHCWPRTPVCLADDLKAKTVDTFSSEFLRTKIYRLNKHLVSVINPLVHRSPPCPWIMRYTCELVVSIFNHTQNPKIWGLQCTQTIMEGVRIIYLCSAIYPFLQGVSVNKYLPDVSFKDLVFKPDVLEMHHLISFHHKFK